MRRQIPDHHPYPIQLVFLGNVLPEKDDPPVVGKDVEVVDRSGQFDRQDLFPAISVYDNQFFLASARQPFSVRGGIDELWVIVQTQRSRVNPLENKLWKKVNIQSSSSLSSPARCKQ